MGSNQFSNTLFGSFIYLNENVLTITMEKYWKTKKKGGFSAGEGGDSRWSEDCLKLFMLSTI